MRQQTGYSEILRERLLRIRPRIEHARRIEQKARAIGNHAIADSYEAEARALEEDHGWLEQAIAEIEAGR